MRIPELSELSSTVRLPPMRDVVVSERVARLIDHPAFQRLRLVRQLGPLHWIYPGATHTRFEHSLGVYGLSLEYLRALLRDPQASSLTEADICVGFLAALLHDIGHYPFAHSLEATHVGGIDPPRHEELAEAFVMGRVPAWQGGGTRTLAQDIEHGFGVPVEDVLQAIRWKPRAHARPERRLVATVVSSGMDADKADYLERDALHMGLPFGAQHDRQRLLSALMIHPEGDRIALAQRGRTAAESFVFARYAMFSEGYWHHTARAVASMVEEAMRDLRAQGVVQGEAFQDLLLQLDDDRLLEHLCGRAHEGSAAAALLRGLTRGQRRLYKRVLTLSLAYDDVPLQTAYDRVFYLDAAQVAMLREVLRGVVERHVGRRLQPWELLIDTPPRDKDHVEDIDLVSSRGSVQALSQSSQIVRGVASDFVKVVKKIRVFVAPDVRETLVERGTQEALRRALVEAILAFSPDDDAQTRLL